MELRRKKWKSRGGRRLGVEVGGDMAGGRQRAAVGEGREAVGEAAGEEPGQDGGARRFALRTDLAVEERESVQGDGGEIAGVTLRKWQRQEGEIRLTEVKILDAKGARAMGKPVGTYLTLEADCLSEEDVDYHSRVSDELGRLIGRLIEEVTEQGLSSKGQAAIGNRREGLTEGRTERKKPLSILAVGLGNVGVTPDSLGPRVVGNLLVTRHLNQMSGGAAKAGQEDGIQAGGGAANPAPGGSYFSGENSERPASISAIAPGVMAQTGMETAEILRGIIRETKPDMVIAVDALAARSVRRLGTTIQLTDTGIHPGSGVGNHRHSLTRKSLGVPVLAIGVPTVVGAAAIVHDTVSALIGVLAEHELTKETGSWIESMSPDEQYQLIRELLEPEFGPLYVTPPDIDQTIKQLSFTISEGIHRAVFPG